TGQRTYAAKNLVQKRIAVFLVRIFHFGQINLRREQMSGAESWIEVPQVDKTVDQQSGANRQHEGDGDFRNHEQAAEPRSFAALRSATATFIQRFIKIEVRRLRRWRETEDQAGDKCHQRGEDKDPCIDADRVGL